MAESNSRPVSTGGFASVNLKNIGPIAEGKFQVKPLTLLTGRNGAGKTITSTLLYILQKCLWSSLRSNQRTFLASLTAIERTGTKEVHETQNLELLALLQGSRFQGEIQSAFTDELTRAFGAPKHILRHNTRTALFQVIHSLGWSFDCALTSNTLKTALTVHTITLPKPVKESPRQPPPARQSRIAAALREAFGGWQDRPIMIPAGRAGITDSYRYLAEQILLERHGYRQGGPSGITRDFLALLVGSTQAPFFGPEDTEFNDLVTRLFDPLLGGRLRPSSDPEELFTFDVKENRIDRNVMSSMVKELGPMVVLLQQSMAKGTVLIVDEPECHLHPRAQIELARALVLLVSQDARFFLSTHSPYLAQSLSNTWVEQSRKGEVSSANMAVINFSDSAKGVTAKNVPFHEQYGFTFEDFTDSANAVQDEFVELFS